MSLFNRFYGITFFTGCHVIYRVFVIVLPFARFARPPSPNL